jgi:glycerate kinase
MRVLVAPNAFKGSLSAHEAARVMGKAVRRAGAIPVELPLADGGDGTLDVLKKPFQLIYRRSKTTDPLGRPLTALWGYNPRTRVAVIEMARASGLVLLNERERDPLLTSSFGMGMLVRAALRAGARSLWIGLGGSATVDGGVGILQALGAKIVLQRNEHIHDLTRPFVGKDLVAIHSMDTLPLQKLLKGVTLYVLCDVSNPLLGPRGAARAFGPQKGATPQAVRQLDRGLARFAHVIGVTGPTIQCGLGAAGGAAAGLRAGAHGKLKPGAQTLFRVSGVEGKVKRSDVVLTGEGQVDRTSWEGKSLGALVRLCRLHKKPLIVFTGRKRPGRDCRGATVVCLGGKKTPLSQKLRWADSFLSEAVETFLINMKK